MNTTHRGFTIIELLFIVVIISAASIIFFVQKNNLEIAARDETRKIAINAMYYSLEEVYFKANGSYPRTINETVLPSMDPELFSDPQGIKIGEANSDYRYEGLNCEADTCKSYVLRTILENEADFIKNNRTD